MNLSEFFHNVFHSKKGERIAVTVVATIFLWLAIESWFLSGKTLLNRPNHPLGTPITFTVDAPRESHALTLGRSGGGPGVMRRRKQLEWTITDPGGNIILEDQDIVPRETRMTTFTPLTSGEHTLLVQHQSPDGTQGKLTIIISGGDHTFLLPLLDFLW